LWGESHWHAKPKRESIAADQLIRALIAAFHRERGGVAPRKAWWRSAEFIDWRADAHAGRA
jgi:hypothetical protein